jgi:hypothetical protein
LIGGSAPDAHLRFRSGAGEGFSERIRAGNSWCRMHASPHIHWSRGIDFCINTLFAPWTGLFPFCDVAVALLPPLVEFGMLLGAGHLFSAMGALLLFSSNIVSINLAGVGTFLLQGVRPRTWWEGERAQKATRAAVITWFLLLASLAGIMYVSQRVSFS